MTDAEGDLPVGLCDLTNDLVPDLPTLSTAAELRGPKDFGQARGLEQRHLCEGRLVLNVTLSCVLGKDGGNAACAVQPCCAVRWQAGFLEGLVVRVVNSRVRLRRGSRRVAVCVAVHHGSVCYGAFR